MCVHVGLPLLTANSNTFLSQPDKESIMEAIGLPEEGLQMKSNSETAGGKTVQFDALLNMSKSIFFPIHSA